MNRFSNLIHAFVTERGSVSVAQIAAHFTNKPYRYIVSLVCQMASGGRLITSGEYPRKTYEAGRQIGMERAGLPNAWSAEEDGVLRRDYCACGPKKLAPIIGRTPKAIEARARLIGIRRQRPPAKPKSVQKVKPVPTESKAAFPVTIPRRIGPAHLPGDPVFTDRTRHVVGPRMPQPMRTNTYSMY